MKIGFLSYRSNPFSGGQGIYVKHLSHALVNLGHEVDIISGPPYTEWFIKSQSNENKPQTHLIQL